MSAKVSGGDEMKKGREKRFNTTATDIQTETGELTIFISGRLSLDTMDEVVREVRALIKRTQPAAVAIDCSGIDYLDSAGAMALLSITEDMASRSVPCRLANLREDHRNVLELLDPSALSVRTRASGRSYPGLISYIGEASRAAVNDGVMLMTFLGDVIHALGHSCVHPRSIRWNDVLHYMARAGVEGLPIVGLISLLVGLIIAFMSSLQLKPLGGNIFVASLVGIAVVKELGPLMTAIIVAGRSGSAFAAEIGTMVVNEELDALVTMGFDPVEFLALPKVVAALLVVPLLTLYADLFGLVGGLIVGVVGMDLTVGTYVNQTAISISLNDVATGLVKSIVFAALIAGIGCHKGLQVKRGAEGVGAATTSAVVSAIFLIVVADSVFAIVFHYV